MAVTFTTTAQAGFENGIKAFIYGESGNGKTTLLGTLPAESTLIITVEKGLLPLRGKNIAVAQCETYEDVVSIYNALAQDPAYGRFVNIGLDSFSELAERILVYSLSKIKDGRQAYDDMNKRSMQLLRLIADLPRRNVFVLGKAETEKDGATGIMMTQPSAPGRKLAPQIPYQFDEVYYLGVFEQKVNDVTEKRRYLLTDRTPQIIAKSRASVLAQYEEPNLTNLLHKIHNTPIA